MKQAVVAAVHGQALARGERETHTECESDTNTVYLDGVGAYTRLFRFDLSMNLSPGLQRARLSWYLF